MILEVVSVFDRAISTFGRPVFVPHTGAAMRSFMDEVSGAKDSELGKHPEDYDLMHLGSFDDQVGRFHQLEVPKLLVAGKAIGRK